MTISRLTPVDLSVPPLHQLPQALLWRLAQSVAATDAVLFLVDDGGRLMIRASEPAGPFSDPEGATALAGRAMDDGRVLAEPSLEGPDGAYELEAGGVALLACPLRAHGRVFGATCVRLIGPRALTSDDLERFRSLVDGVALSLDYARLLAEPRRYAAELERVNRQLIEMDRLKAEFLSMVSHELRTPLTAIIGYTDLLLREVHGPLNERQTHFQRSVRTGARRLLALVNDLLDVSRLQGGRFDLNARPTELQALISQAVDGARVDAEARGVALRCEMVDQPLRTQADAERITQVLNNLLSNAIKFTPPGGQVVIGVEWIEQRELCISVRDTGVGIAPDHLPHIWGRFYQANSSARRIHGGTGLGLALVKGLVELHGGRVWATSEGTGLGSTFLFTLPLVRERLVEPVAVGMPAARVRRVLVLAADPGERAFLCKAAEAMVGHVVTGAASASQAAESARREQTEVLLVDVASLRPNGDVDARRLRDALPNQTALIATGDVSDDDRQRLLEQGVEGFLGEPFSADELAEVLASVARAGTRGG